MKSKENSSAMAAVPKDQTAPIQKKKSRKESRPQKNLAKQSKLSSRSRRNTGLVRLPKSCDHQNYPLASWSFNKEMWDNVLSTRMPKRPPGSFWAEAYRLMTMPVGGQKKKHRPHFCPDFLKATIKATDKRQAKRKGAPVAKTAQPKKGCSDKEIFYKLAKPPMLSDVRAGPSGTNAKTPNVASHIPRPVAGALQPVFN